VYDEPVARIFQQWVAAADFSLLRPCKYPAFHRKVKQQVFVLEVTFFMDLSKSA
jgi:hypothetical protein